MKKLIPTIISVVVILTLATLSIVLGGYTFNETQLEIFYILLIICGSSALYCFVVGEISRNNSQMDKLWSLLPIAYTWVIAIKGGMDIRLIIYAILVTLWGIRLTFNFARKGAYRIKFWEGEEDYRWAILRKNSILKNRFLWALFDLFFISIYQNLLVLAICLPALACVGSTATFGLFDYIASISAALFLVIELIADEEQWKFHQTKKALLNEGKSLEELDEPYSRGFNTIGLWGYLRHPNYLGEQGFWFALYFFVLGAGATMYGVFNMTLVGPLFLILLFLGSSTFGESISSSKYPKYSDYQRQVFKYLPLRKYKDEDDREETEEKA